MNSELLPIGSIVEVRQERAPRFMILGYYPETDDEAGDYLAVPHPLGALLESAGVILDENDIANVVHYGYQDDLGAQVLREARDIIVAEYSLE